MPRLAKALSSAIPPTTGGRTRGRRISARTSAFPRNGTRARTHESGSPNTTARNVAETEQTIDRRKAPSASGLVKSVARVDQATRLVMPTSGIAKNATVIADRVMTTNPGRR